MNWLDMPDNAMLNCARLLESLDQAAVAMLTLDLDARVTGWSTGATRLYGYAAHEAIGRIAPDLLMSDSASEEYSNVARRVRLQSGGVYETRHRTRSGAVIDVEICFTPIRDEHGQLIGQLSLARDISARMGAKQAVREEDMRMRSIVEAAAHGMVLIDADGRIALVNRQLEQIFGYSRAELIGASIELLLPEELADLHLAHRARYLARPQPRAMGIDPDLQGRRKDGTAFPVEVALSPIHDGPRTFVLATVVDITERKRAQEALAAERSLLRTLIDALPDLVFTKDPNGNFALSNSAHLAYLRMEREAQLVGRSVFDFYPPELAQRFHEDDLQVLSGVPLVDREEPGMDGAGRQYWFLTNKVPLRDANGAIVGLVGISRDITDRRAIEHALRNSENRFRQLAESLPQLIWTSRADGACDYLSRQWVQYTGIGVESQLGSGWLQQVHPDDRELLMLAWKVAKDASAQFRKEIRVRRYDGEYRWFDTRAVPLYDIEGRVVKWIGSNTDIHEARTMREALQQQAMLIALAQDPILVWDPESGIVLWNSGCEQLYGYTREEALGQNGHALLKTVFPVSAQAFQAQLEREQQWSGELQQTTKDGRSVAVASRHQKVVVGGHSLILEANRDITERKRTEEYQLRAQKMEALGTLAGGIAHDFNNILLAISGNTRLSMQDLPADHPVQEFLQEIDKAAARAANLVRRILSFSRQQDPQREIVQLPAVVEEAVRLLRATLPAMIEIRYESHSEVARIAADATQIHQVVMNLVTNAAHAIGLRKGLIELKIDELYVTREMTQIAVDLREARYVRLTVSDNGSGMDKDTLERIFDPFFTTKPVGTGTGLGLSTVHGIVKRHDGAINVYSALNQGTVFHVYFPAVEQPSDQASAAPLDTLQGRGERILYLDDEEALVQLSTRMLTRLGYQVEPHTDPAQALEAFRTRPGAFDAVVTDLSMPGMSGFDFALALRAIRADVHIVMTSGYVREEDQERAARLGVQELILKPTTVEELARILHRQLQLSRGAQGR